MTSGFPTYLDPWRDAVRGATDAVALIELPSTRFVELSRAARELVGPACERGLEVLVPDERPEAAAIIKGAVAGVIDGTEARRHRWQRSDGSMVEVTVRARVIRLQGANLGVWIARDVACEGDVSVPGPTRDRPQAPTVSAMLDDRWRVCRLTGDDADLFSNVLREGVAVTSVTHPDDRAPLLFAFAGATTHTDDVATPVRLLQGDDCVAVSAVVSRPSGRSWRLELAPVRRRETADQGTKQRVKDLEGYLRRIAGELEAAGLFTGSATTVDVLRVPGVSGLPERQREIVVRLASGERVGTIARRMYLSANTVRNHLSAVFKKFGVHSQEELLVLLLRDEGDEAATAR
jgi:DNA-binding CsgD family transcriptional regulator